MRPGRVTTGIINYIAESFAMIRKTKLNNAIVLALSTTTGFVAIPANAALEEVVVTATKRAENLQDVSITVTALAEEKLDQLNIANFDDYIRYLPSVNSAGDDGVISTLLIEWNSGVGVGDGVGVEVTGITAASNIALISSAFRARS